MCVCCTAYILTNRLSLAIERAFPRHVHSRSHIDNIIRCTIIICVSAARGAHAIACNTAFLKPLSGCTCGIAFYVHVHITLEACMCVNVCLPCACRFSCVCLCDPHAHTTHTTTHNNARVYCIWRFPPRRVQRENCANKLICQLAVKVTPSDIMVSSVFVRCDARDACACICYCVIVEHIHSAAIIWESSSIRCDPIRLPIWVCDTAPGN